MVSIQTYYTKKHRFISETENYFGPEHVHQGQEFFNCSSDVKSEALGDSTPPLALHNENQNSPPMFWRPWNGTRRPFRCRTCTSEKTFKRNPELRRHMRTAHLSHIERCGVCLQEFTRKDNLTRHMKTKHNVKVKPACKFCFKQLSRRDAVHRHESTCHLNADYIPRISTSYPDSETLENYNENVSGFNFVNRSLE